MHGSEFPYIEHTALPAMALIVAVYEVEGK